MATPGHADRLAGSPVAVLAMTLSAGWLFPVGEAVDVEVRFGVPDADTSGTSVLGGISLWVYR